MPTTASNLRKLAAIIGIERVSEELELLLDGSSEDLEIAQHYLSGALKSHMMNTSPSEVEVREWYELLGLSADETQQHAARTGN